MPQQIQDKSNFGAYQMPVTAASPSEDAGEKMIGQVNVNSTSNIEVPKPKSSFGGFTFGLTGPPETSNT